MRRPRSAPPTPDVDPGTLRTRRRFARRQWARRWLAWRPVLVVLALLALVVGAVWLVFFSSTLAVTGVRVEGTRDLDPGAVRDAAAVPTGEPLARVDLDRIRSRVEAMAMVSSAEVTRQWPDQVRIEVEEREAVAVVVIGGQVRGMDAEGVVFRSYAKPPPGLPTVRTSSETRRDALEEAALVVESLPGDLATRVDHVEVATIDQISLVLRDGRTVTWGSAEESDAKAEVLTELLRIKAREYDVSVPGQPRTSG